MSEHNIIKAFLDNREAYSSLSPLIGPEKDLSEVGAAMLKEIEAYYAIDSTVTSVDAQVILERLCSKYPKKVELFHQYFSNFPVEVSIPNISADLVAIKKKQLSSEIIVALSTNRPAEELLTKYLTYNIATPSLLNGEVFQSVPVSELVESVQGINLIPIFPSVLNEQLGGGVPRESHLLVYARPDAGKSTFVINLAGGLLTRGYKVLYIGNEDPHTYLLLRMLSRLTEAPKEAIIAAPAKFQAIASAKGYDNLTFVSLHPGTVRDIRSLVSTHKPDVLIVDQLRNLRASKENSVVNLEEAARGTRSIAKEFGIVVVVVTQAGDSADNKLVLDMGDVDNSNTGIPGQMDLMIGIGTNPEFKVGGRMMLSLPKNKLSAPIKPFVVKVDYTINKLVGLRL